MGYTSKGHASMTALDPSCVHHKPFQIFNAIVLRSYSREISMASLTIFPLSTLNEPQGYSNFKKIDIFDSDAFEWQLDRLFGI